MSEITKKEVCKCINCGNEAEMVFTCTLQDEPAPKKPEPRPKKVKAKGTCSHCGNEADMWIDL